MAISCPHARLPPRFWWWRNENRWPSGSRRIDTQVIIMTGGFGPRADRQRKHDIPWHHARRLFHNDTFFCAWAHIANTQGFSIVCFYFFNLWLYHIFTIHSILKCYAWCKYLALFPVIVKWKYKNNAARTAWQLPTVYKLHQHQQRKQSQSCPECFLGSVETLQWGALGKKHKNDFGQEHNFFQDFIIWPLFVLQCAYCRLLYKYQLRAQHLWT